VKHVVLCDFVDDLPAAELASVIADFAALADTVDSVQHLEHGENVSPEGLDDGFTHCFIVTFADAAARDAYLVDPVHLAFVERFKPTLKRILVVDF
jgi:hypothetical protein